MQKLSLRLVSPCLLAVTLLVALIQTPSAHAQTIPTDAKPTCTVSSAQFASWFQTGSVTPNGIVNPANSVTFSHANNCSFYQWSKQMFLWLTSPAPASYGGGGRVFDSQVFYDVSPPDVNGNRVFLPHVPGQIRNLGVRTAQLGPHGLPVIIDRSGRLLEVQPPPADPIKRPLIRSRAGTLVPAERAIVNSDGSLLLQDKAGKAIAPAPRPIRAAAPQAGRVETVQKFVLGGVPIFVDSSGNVIDVEQGQAGGGGVLLAQNGSLIYYATMVNDVYAYFLTGAKTGGIVPMPSQFPTTQASLNQVKAFAAKSGKVLPDANALAIEVKTSWIEAAGLPNLSSYITMNATVPTYDRSNPNKWTPNGQKTVLLAMVGLHVVGSTAGHPEMVWSTFEHFGNAPNGAYLYVTASGQTKVVPQNTAGTWLLASNSSSGPFNSLNAKVSGSDIVAASSSAPISPSNTLRVLAWGASANASPNPEDASSAVSNTALIAINNSVGSLLPKTDVRNNYFMTGSTWTNGGVSPTTSYGNPGNPTGTEIGTSLISNATMETFQQPPNQQFAATGDNCLRCHHSNTTSVSHVYSSLKPLP